MKNLISLILIVVLTITITEAQSMFIKFDGVDGEAIDKDHKGWSDLASLSQGIMKPASATGATRRRGAAILEDITCVKELDKASPKLAEAVLKGKVFPKVEIHLTKSLPRTGRTVYYAYELKNVQVTSYQINTSGNDIPTEEVALNFEEIKATYTEFDSQGREKGKVEYSWKVEANR